MAPHTAVKISYCLSTVNQRVAITSTQNSECIFFMILCSIQPSDTKQILEFFFQASVVVELRVINPDGTGADGSEDVLFCFNIQIEVVNSKKIEVI